MNSKKICAYVFSILPGAGHLYLGVQKKGIQLMACFLGLILLHNLTNFPIIVFLVTMVWIYSIFDVRRILRYGGNNDECLNFKINFKSKLNFKSKINFKYIFPKIVAWIFIILGIRACIFYIPTALDYEGKKLISSSITAIILILLGFKFIKGKKKI